MIMNEDFVSDAMSPEEVERRAVLAYGVLVALNDESDAEWQAFYAGPYKAAERCYQRAFGIRNENTASMRIADAWRLTL